MKKIFSLSIALLAFGFQGSANANANSPDELVDSFCIEVEDLGIQNDSDSVAELLRSYIADLDNPSMDQIIALSQIGVKLETGQSFKSICK